MTGLLDRQEVIAVLDMFDVGTRIAPHYPSYREGIADALMALAETARPMPTREQIAKAVHDAVHPNCAHQHVMYADDGELEAIAADAVLALLKGAEA